MGEVEEAATQSLVSSSCELMRPSILLSEKAKKQVLLRKTVKCFSSLPLVKITMATMVVMDTVAVEQDTPTVVMDKTEARMGRMVEILAAIQEGRDQDLTWE